jgi:predicted nucleic acid-binding protein
MIVCLDTDCVIYLVEQHPRWGPRVISRLLALRSAGSQIAVSDLARTEVLAGPIHKGQTAILADFQAFFADPDIHMLPLTPAVCERAAHLRAASNFQLKVPDCLHLAAAIEHGCGLFLTHDARLKHCSAIPVEILS